MTAADPMPGELVDRPGWTTPAFARVARWLHAEVGLVFPASRRDAVERALSRVASEARLRDADALLAALERGGPIVDAVIGELTIGETYFFREPRQLDVVRDCAFPAADRPRDRPFRAWSAGCASGEEPYTLAIMLREARPTVPARILGTDLASVRLAAARRGRYTRWSFRGVSEDVVTRYFKAERRHFVLDPSIRAAVDFRVLNLAEDAYPSAATGIGAMDLILCRNVLIYFDAETVRQVATRLIASLSDDGWLFLGASDPMIGDLVACETVVTDAGLAYRRPRDGGGQSRVRDARATDSLVPPPRWNGPSSDVLVPASAPPSGIVRVGDVPTPAPTLALASVPPIAPASVAPATVPPAAPAPSSAVDAAGIRAAYAAGDYDRAADLALRLDRAAWDESIAVVLVRSLANRGRLGEAAAACLAALERYPASAELEYLHALVLDEGGHQAAAVTAVRRALYLDRRLTPAHLLLGELLARAGDRAGAVRSFGNAATLLESMPADAEVAAADGTPAVRLLHIARTRASAVAEAGR